MVIGAGMGFGFEAQAPTLSEATAKAATAANLTNFIRYFPLLSSRVAGRV